MNKVVQLIINAVCLCGLRWRVAGLSVVVFLSRLPFISPGYGDDPDAWRVALSADYIIKNLNYVFSRKPGYPFQEIVYACLGGMFGQNHIIFNMATVILSVVAVICFAMILKEIGCGDIMLASACFAFTPCIYINSVNAMDYIWALAFVLAGLLAILKGRWRLSGVFIGIAIGCRITSSAMVLPLSMLLVFKNGVCLKRVFTFVIISLFTGCVCFVPVFLRNGFGFFSCFDIVYPPYLILLKKSTVMIWGVLGSLSLLFGVILFIFHKLRYMNRKYNNLRRINGSDAVCIVAVVIYYAIFLRMPAESGYLIPCVPFVIILCARLFNKIMFRFFCVMVILSSFPVFHISYLNGASITANRADRVYRAKYVDTVLKLSQRFENKSVVVCGSWLPQIMVQLKESGIEPSAQYVYSIDRHGWDSYIVQGYRVYYLPHVNDTNIVTRHLDLIKVGAKPFFESIMDNNQ